MFSNLNSKLNAWWVPLSKPRPFPEVVAILGENLHRFKQVCNAENKMEEMVAILDDYPSFASEESYRAIQTTMDTWHNADPGLALRMHSFLDVAVWRCFDKFENDCEFYMNICPTPSYVLPTTNQRAEG